MLSNRFETGQRLPAERAFSTELRASRVSVRHALQRLADWGVISIRHGSGAVLRPRWDWTVGVLPHAVFHWIRKNDPVLVRRSLEQMLEIRRILYCAIMRAVARALSGRRLDDQRRELEMLCASRERAEEFVVREVQLLRSLVTTAELELYAWVLNTLADAYISSARPLQAMLPVPAECKQAYLTYFDHIERGEPDAAVAAIDRYLDEWDQQILKLLTSAP